MTDSEWFPAKLETFGDRIAVVTEDGAHTTYAELADRSARFAAELGPERRLVAVEGSNTLDALVAYLGALRGRHPVILTTPEAANQQDIVACYAPDFRVSAAGREDRRQAPRTFHPDLALLLSTSGTTGSAKLVRLSWQSVQSNAAAIGEYLQLGPDERPITSLPMHYSYGMSVVNSHLNCGATLLLTERSVIEPAFWAFAAQVGATSLAGVPHTYELLERIRFRERDVAPLRYLTQAGGRLSRELIVAYGEWARDRGARFYVMYGQTEAAPRMAYLPPERVLEAPDAIGAPIPGGRFELVDEAGGETTGPDAVGELVYHGPNVMLGYAQSVSDLARGRDADRLMTGDLATRGADGLYRIVGRKSRFAKVFGLRVNLDDVEVALAAKGYRAAAVSDDRVIGLALVAPAPAAALVQQLSETYKLPPTTFQATVVDDLPTLPSGKVDYRAIMAGLAQPEADPHEGDAAKALEQAFVRAFHRAPAPGDSFVSLGGDSLNYVEISIEVEERLGFLPPGWEALTLAELQAMAPRPARGRALFKPIDSEILFRALAITAVVVNHVSPFVVGGGAEVLILLAGYNLARYQRQRLFAGGGFQVLTSFVGRVIVPYYLALLVYLTLERNFDVASLLMVSNYFGRFGRLIEPFWFLEALLQCMIVVTLLMAVPRIRRLAARDPWRFGLGLTAAAVAVKLAVGSLLVSHQLLNRTGDAVFYLLAFGWCVQQANTTARKLLLSALALIFSTLGLIHFKVWQNLPWAPSLSHAIWLSTACLMILWIPRIPIPKLLHRAVTTIAAAAFYIYLSHVIPVGLLYWRLHITNLPLNLLVAIALGILTWRVFQVIDLNAIPWLRRLRPTPASP